MDIAEMKVAGKGKASAKPNINIVKGEALATTMVNYAWKASAEIEARAGKLALFVQDICALTKEAHGVFRAQLTIELKSIDELEKQSDIKESRKAGYSLNSFKVMVSNWRAISEAAQIGFTGKDEAGKPLAWTQALETAREYRKAHASAGGTHVQTATGAKAGAGRKAMSAYDKALKVVGALDRKDQRAMLETLAAMFKATVAFPVKASAQKAAQAIEAGAPVLH